jgi:nitrite reductase (NO-forming)
MLVSYFQMAAQGQPHWLQPWFDFWLAVIAPNEPLFLWGTRIAETLLAAGLLLGLARPWVYILGAGYSLMIWSTVEGFGGPYGAGSTDVGTGVIYVLVFVGLLILYRIQNQTPFTLDSYLRRRFPDWPRLDWGVLLLPGRWRPRLAEQVVADRGRGSSPKRLGPMK